MPRASLRWQTDSKDMARKYLKRQCDGRALKEQELQDFFTIKWVKMCWSQLIGSSFLCVFFDRNRQVTLTIIVRYASYCRRKRHTNQFCVRRKTWLTSSTRPHVFTQRSEAWRQSYKAVEERLASRKARPLGTPSRIGLREASFRAVLFEIGKTRS